MGITWHAADGDSIQVDQIICTLDGRLRSLLTGERTALNFLQLLSGTATITRQYVDLLNDSRSKLLDTRKTIPGLRSAQKYAVACGGGYNHRMGLYDAILIKDNHIEAAGGITAAINTAKSTTAAGIEIEVENLDQFREAVAAGADRILLDNFSLGQIDDAVALNAGRCALEVSGGIDLHNLQAVAATGVDFISVGALTKHVRAIDFSMNISR